MLLVSVGKGVIFAGLAKIFGYGNVVPLAVGLGLFQIGEFSFVLARVGVGTESISRDFYNLILTAAVLTMVLTPIVSAQTGRLYALKKRWFRHEPLESFDLQWIRLEPGNRLITRRIGEAEIRKTTGISVVGIIREQQLMANPDVGFRFQGGDLLAIIGSVEARACSHRFFE